MRYDVDTAALRADATSVGEVLSGVRALGVPEVLRPVAVALPGGRTAAGGSRVAAAWEVRLASSQWDLRELGRSLLGAADLYDGVEEAARAALGHADGGSR